MHTTISKRRKAPGLGLLLAALLSAVFSSASAAEKNPPATRWIRDDAVFVLEIGRPGPILDLFLSQKLADEINSLPPVQLLYTQPKFLQFQGMVRYVESQIASDWRTALRRLFSGGATLAVNPDGSTLLAIDAQDRTILDRLHEIAVGLARTEGEKAGDRNRVSSRDYKGATAWAIGPEEAHAILGSRLLLANKPDSLRSALDLRSEEGSKGLSSSPTYAAARKAVGDGALATLFVNMKVLKLHPPVRKALEEGRDPFGSLLLAGVVEALQKSTWLALGLRLEGDALSLTARMDCEGPLGTGPASFASPKGTGEGILPILKVPRAIAGLSFFRDLHGFYAAKDELFPERTSGLIFFENMMGIFFSGLNLTEEVLAETRPEIRFVVAEQEFDPAYGAPRVQYPAFAAVIPLRHPKEFGDVVEEAWQKFLGLMNFTRGQQALPGLIIDRVIQGDTKFSVAYFRQPKTRDEKGLDPRYNVRPAMALKGDSLILSSTEGLARDIIDALGKEAADPPKPLRGAHSLLDLRGDQLVSILRANRENMIRENMVEKGNTEEEARQTVDLLFFGLKYLKGVKFSLGESKGLPEGRLELKLNLPEIEKRKMLLRAGSERAMPAVPSAEGGPVHGR